MDRNHHIDVNALWVSAVIQIYNHNSHKKDTIERIFMNHNTTIHDLVYNDICFLSFILL